MDRQESHLAARQRELFAQADAAYARGDKHAAERLETQAAGLASFYD